jgi:hypothetical protein
MEENFGEFEATLASLSCRLDEMDAAIQQLRVQALPRCLVSDSVNPGRPSPPNADVGNDIGNTTVELLLWTQKRGLNISQGSLISRFFFLQLVYVF